LQFGADPGGSRDSSDAFAQAIRQLDVVQIPAGTFQVANVALRGGVALAGEGEASVLRQKAGAAFAFVCDSGSADPSANMRGIAIRNLQLRGGCDVEGFSEHSHLLSLNGVSDVMIERVLFRGFRGDGIYLGSGHTGGTERHNQRIVVRDCVFDGINRENRNGISVIDGDDVAIEKCRFLDMTRHDMPGAIDLEPDANAFHVVRNVRISGNAFRGIGGSATIALYVPKRLRLPVGNIVVEDNVFEDTRETALALVQLFAPPLGAPGQGIVVRGNRVQGRNARAFDLRGVAGVDLRYNRFEGATQSAAIGHREPRDAVRNIALHGNKFIGCGSEEGAAVSVFSVSLLVFADNEWIDCGDGRADSCAVDFVEGASERVSFSGNRFASPSGKTKIAIRREAAHRLDANSNVYASDNVVDGRLRNAFDAKGRVPR
jgi:hypothetical protein